LDDPTARRPQPPLTDGAGVRSESAGPRIVTPEVNNVTRRIINVPCVYSGEQTRVAEESVHPRVTPKAKTQKSCDPTLRHHS
jgi:hypothetical protein